MARFPILTVDTAPAAAKPSLENIASKLGHVPNYFGVAANSAAVVAANGALGRELSKALDLKTRERIALATAAVNGCEYCDAAHSYTGHKFAKLSVEEIALARTGRSADEKADAAVTFARKVAEARGKVSDGDIEAVRAAGYSDGEVLEIVALVAENFFTNLINNVARTDIDFPAIGNDAA